MFPKCRIERLKNSFLVRSCINNETEFFGGLSNVNENEFCNVYI